MGQFKPMVKMMTTEPTVELKLKKGGSVKGHKCMKSGGKAEGHGHKPMGMMNGGVSTALANQGMTRQRPIVTQPGPNTRPPKVEGPKKPNLIDRYNKMYARSPEKAMSFAERRGFTPPKTGVTTGSSDEFAIKNQTTGLKNGGDAMKALKKHEGKPASKAHKGLKTGGVVKGQGGYKTGGVIKGQGGYKDGGCATMKKGGKTGKKMATGGGLGGLVPASSAQIPGAPQSTMIPVGAPIKKGSGRIPSPIRRPLPPPISGSMDLMGRMPGDRGYIPTPVMKKGGSSKKFAEGGSVQDGGRPQKMAQGAKKPSSPVEISRLSGAFKKGGKVKKYGGGGDVAMTFDESFQSPEEQMKEMRMRKAMNEGYKGVAKRDTEANEALLDSLTSLPRSVKNMLRKAMRGSGAVTDTETTVSRTVVPAKKRGGKV